MPTKLGSPADGQPDPGKAVKTVAVGDAVQHLAVRVQRITLCLGSTGTSTTLRPDSLGCPVHRSPHTPLQSRALHKDGSDSHMPTPSSAAVTPPSLAASSTWSEDEYIAAEALVALAHSV